MSMKSMAITIQDSGTTINMTPGSKIGFQKMVQEVSGDSMGKAEGNIPEIKPCEEN